MDINQANRQQLEQAFQVSGERAEHILRKREQIGGFESWDQLKESVPGIDDKTVAHLQDAGLTLGKSGGNGKGRAGAQEQGPGQRQERQQAGSKAQAGQAQDATAVLETDHQRVEALFADYQRAGKEDAVARHDLAQIICMELRVHTMLEEEIFYPAFRKASGNDKLVQHAESEHNDATQLMDRIEKADDPDPLVAELQQVIERHLDEERTQIFAEARRAPGMDLRSLAQNIESRRAELVSSYAEH